MPKDDGNENCTNTKKNKPLRYLGVFAASSLAFLFPSGAIAFDQCDDVSEGRFVRYDKGYGFWNTWNNNESRSVYLNNASHEFINGNFVDRGQLHPDGNDTDALADEMSWTSEIRSAEFGVPPGTSIRVYSTAANDWLIDEIPDARSSASRDDFDFAIRYSTVYDYSNNYPDGSDDITYRHCVYYSVTWCGDGVVDMWPTQAGGNEREECDPADPTSYDAARGEACSDACAIVR